MTTPHDAVPATAGSAARRTLRRTSGGIVLALVTLAAPAAAAPQSVPVTAPILPADVAAHFRDIGVTVDPRQEPEAEKATPRMKAATGRPRLAVPQRAYSATIARLGLGGGDYAIAWSRTPTAGRIEAITAVHDRYARSTAHFLDSGALKRIVNDRGEQLEIRRAGGRHTLSVRFLYGYARDERVVDLPEAAAAAIGRMATGGGATAAERGPGDVRNLRLSVKACPYWPHASQYVDAWVDVDPTGKPGDPAPVWFPLERRNASAYAASVNLTKRAAVERDPAVVAETVATTAHGLCDVVGSSTASLCAAFHGDREANDACNRILEPFTAGLCPAAKKPEDWKVSLSPQGEKQFRRPVKMRFNLRFLSPYGYGWVTSTPIETVPPNRRDIEAKVELPCWDVYEAPLKMTGSYHWPLCTSPYAEATTRVQFANYMKGWYAWAGLSNWTLRVYPVPGCLSSTYVEGPLTPAGPAKLKGNYALWKFDNTRYGGPDHFTGHINFDGKKMWGNVKDDRHWRRTSARATLYGTFSGGRAR